MKVMIGMVLEYNNDHVFANSESEVKSSQFYLKSQIIHTENNYC